MVQHAVALVAGDVVVQHAGHGLGQPVGLEHHEVAQHVVVLVVEDLAQVVQIAAQNLLLEGIVHAAASADRGELLAADVGPIAGLQRLLHVHPGARPLLLHQRELGRLGGNRSLQLLDPSAGLVADRRHAHDLRIGGAEAVQVELGRAFVAVGGDQQHRRAGRQHLDLAQPVVEPALVGVAARVPHQQVKGAAGHEELVGGVVDLLAAEVPDVQGQVDAGAVGAGQADGEHVDAVGGGKMGVEVLATQRSQQRGLAGGAFADQQQLGFKRTTEVSSSRAR